MKKTLKTLLSIAFALLLVFQLGSLDAHAAGNVTATVTGAGNAPGLCTVKTGANEDLLVGVWPGNMVANSVIITPAESEDHIDYVQSVTINGVYAELVATERNTVKIDGEYIASLNLSSDSPVSVVVTLGTIEKTDSASIFYDDGVADISATLSAGASSAVVNQSFAAPDATAEAKAEAISEGREFIGWNLVYANGAVREDVAVGDTIFPYMNFTLEAQWNVVTSVKISPRAQEKVYDGSPALAATGSDAADYDILIYKEGTWMQAVDYTLTGLTFARTDADKDKAEIGVYEFTASGATVKGPDGKTIDAKYVSYDKGQLTIIQRPITVKANDTETVYTSEKIYPNGVTVDATTPLVDGQSVEQATVEYDTYCLRVGSKDITPKKVIIKDAAGNDVSKNYDFTYESGTVTLTKRALTIAPVDTTVGYDGESHTIDFTVVSGSLGANDTLIITGSKGPYTDINEYKDIAITSVAINNSLVQGADKSSLSSYELTWDKKATADLEITGHSLTLRPVSKTTIYAGPSTSLTADSYEIVDGSLLPGHEIDEAALQYEGTINVVADGVGVSKYSNIVPGSVKIIDTNNGDADVTAQYALHFERGTLRIEPIDIVIIAGSNSASYSGNVVKPDAPGYTVVGNLLSNHKLVNVVVEGERTYVGETVTKITSYDIVDKSNNASVLGNNYYRITLNEGKVIVTENPNKPQPETVTVSIKSLTKTYDGTPLSLGANDYVVTDEKNAAAGYTFTVTVDTNSSITNVGSKDIAAPTVVVKDSNGRVVAHSALPFILETEGGKLTVDPLIVTLTAASASKKYDGKALTCAQLASGGATVGNASGKLVSGHTLNKNDIVFKGSQTNVGSSANKIVSAVIRDANGNSMNANYKFVFVDGVLTVTSSAGTGTGTTAGGAATGDNSNLGLWIAILAVLAVAAAAVVFIVIKKKKIEE